MMLTAGAPEDLAPDIQADKEAASLPPRRAKGALVDDPAASLPVVTKEAHPPRSFPEVAAVGILDPHWKVARDTLLGKCSAEKGMTVPLINLYSHRRADIRKTQGKCVASHGGPDGSRERRANRSSPTAKKSTSPNQP